MTERERWEMALPLFRMVARVSGNAAYWLAVCQELENSLITPEVSFWLGSEAESLTFRPE